MGLRFSPNASSNNTSTQLQTSGANTLNAPIAVILVILLFSLFSLNREIFLEQQSITPFLSLFIHTLSDLARQRMIIMRFGGLGPATKMDRTCGAALE
jgi:hypothetical protein